MDNINNPVALSFTYLVMKQSGSWEPYDEPLYATDDVKEAEAFVNKANQEIESLRNNCPYRRFTAEFGTEQELNYGALQVWTKRDAENRWDELSELAEIMAVGYWKENGHHYYNIPLYKVIQVPKLPLFESEDE